MSIRLMVVVLAIALFAGLAPRSNAAITAQSINLCDFKQKLDGQWQGNCFASDGNVYFASSSHASDTSAIFCKYAPLTKQLTVLSSDISATLGETIAGGSLGGGVVPQGKIHSDIIELGGSLYFATHLANYWDAAAKAYTGSHLVRYNLSSGVFTDYGVNKPAGSGSTFAGFSDYSGLTVAGQYAYTFSTPFALTGSSSMSNMGAHVFRTNINTGVVQDLGQLAGNGRGTAHHLLADANNNVWVTIGPGDDGTGGGNGSVWEVKADGSIQKFTNALPAITNGTAPYANSATQTGKWWGFASQSTTDNRMVFTMQADVAQFGGSIYSFDPAKLPANFNTTGDITSGFTKLADTGSIHNSSGFCIAGNKAYFTQRSDKVAGQMPDPPSNGSLTNPAVTLHLMSVDLNLDGSNPAANLTDYGKIIDQSGRTPWRIPSMSTDGLGHLFLVGDWYDGVAGDKLTLKQLSAPSSAAFTTQDRAEFFAVITVPEPQLTAVLLCAAFGIVGRRHKNSAGSNPHGSHSILNSRFPFQTVDRKTNFLNPCLMSVCMSLRWSSELAEVRRIGSHGTQPLISRDDHLTIRVNKRCRRICDWKPFYEVREDRCRCVRFKSRSGQAGRKSRRDDDA